MKRGEAIMISKRTFLKSAAAAAACIASPRFALAVGEAPYPARAVKWVVPYAPGGATDVLSRLLCQYLSDKLGQSFVVENKPGAGTNIGTQAVIASPADGYTLLLTSPRQSRLSQALRAFRWCLSSTTTFPRRPSPNSSPTPGPIRAR